MWTQCGAAFLPKKKVVYFRNLSSSMWRILHCFENRMYNLMNRITLGPKNVVAV